MKAKRAFWLGFLASLAAVISFFTLRRRQKRS
jgi:hypothetical protein